jgi:hypothetical protein
MKNYRKYTMMVLCFLFALNLFSQTENALMPNGLIVNSIISIKTESNKTITGQNDLYLEILPADFVKGKAKIADLIKDGITKKGVPFYNKEVLDLDKKNFGQITLAEINDGINRTDTILIDLNGDAVADTMITTQETNNINKLMFEEKWFFDAQKYTMKKDVVAYWPVIDKYEYMLTGEMLYMGYQMWGAIIPNPKTKNKFQPFLNIKYEYNLGNEELITNSYKNLKDCYYEILYNSDFKIEKKNSPLFSSYSRNKLLEQIIDPVAEGKIKAYDFYSGKELSKKEIDEIMGTGIDSIAVDLDGDLIEDKIIFVPRKLQKEDINSVIFIEEWFIDPATLAIQKKVKGIALVFNEYKWNGIIKEFYRKTIPYMVKLN